MKRFLVLSLFFLFSLVHAVPWNVENEEEALFIRRIADFWQEGEYQIVKGQIEEFLSLYPDSSLSQTLYATLGDLFVREKNYKSALAQYSKINDPEIRNRVFINKMQTLHELQWFATLADESETFLKNEGLEPDQKLQATYFLAQSLYQQCLIAPVDSEMPVHFAQRAKPHFQTLLESELSSEVTEACAYLCTVTKDFSTASQIYLKLADQNGQNREEMLFQAALYQAEFDKKLAAQSFLAISNMNQKRASDALYNYLYLNYDTGQYEEILRKKDELLAQIPTNRQEVAHLFFGRSHLHLKQQKEALQELNLFVQSAVPSETLRSALIDILDTAYQLNDEPSVKNALSRLSDEFPDDQQISKGIIAHALMLKKTEKLDEAYQELELVLTGYQNSNESALALFQQLEIEYQKNLWEKCLSNCRTFLKSFPKHDLNAHVWRYLASASMNFYANATNKEILSKDLETVLSQNLILDDEEKTSWSFLLAKTYYEMVNYPSAIKTLETLLQNPSDFSEKANSLLLLGLCFREQNNDLDKFCELGEKALLLGADLLKIEAIHVALFNAYLSSKAEKIDKAADHLFAASELIEIQLEHLLWMADFYYQKSSIKGPNQVMATHRAIQTYKKALALSKVNIEEMNETNLEFESSIVNLAKLLKQNNQREEEIALLKSLDQQQKAHPTWAWKEESEVALLLASQFVQMGQKEEAQKLFHQIIATNPTLRSFASASATLESARLLIKSWDTLSNDNPEVTTVLAQLKTLILQKSLANEPIHLEAALEYIDLQTRLETPEKQWEKKLSLLLKIKNDFENSSDLLSKDYQNSRKRLLEKNQIYQAYMNLFDAEILYCKSELCQEKLEKEKLKEMAQTAMQEIQNLSPSPFITLQTQNYLENLR